MASAWVDELLMALYAWGPHEHEGGDEDEDDGDEDDSHDPPTQLTESTSFQWLDAEQCATLAGTPYPAVDASGDLTHAEQCAAWKCLGHIMAL